MSPTIQPGGNCDSCSPRSDSCKASNVSTAQGNVSFKSMWSQFCSDSNKVDNISVFLEAQTWETLHVSLKLECGISTQKSFGRLQGCLCEK